MSDNDEHLFGGSDESPWVEFIYQGYTYSMKRRYAEEMDGEVESALARAEDDEETVTGEPFCGCYTCILREVIAVTLVYVVDGMERGLVKKRKVKAP